MEADTEDDDDDKDEDDDEIDNEEASAVPATGRCVLGVGSMRHPMRS